MAELSRKLGEINTHVPLEDTLEDIKLEEWDKPKVLEIFEELRFNRYIDRFKLRDGVNTPTGENGETQDEVRDKHFEIVETKEIPNLSDGNLYYYLEL